MGMLWEAPRPARLSLSPAPVPLAGRFAASGLGVFCAGQRGGGSRPDSLPGLGRARTANAAIPALPAGYVTGFGGSLGEGLSAGACASTEGPEKPAVTKMPREEKDVRRSDSIIPCFLTIEIVLGELAAFAFQSEFVRRERTIVTADCCTLNPLVRRVIRFLGVYAFGLFATDIFVNAGQVVMGSPTPHFLTVCRPNYTALGCSQPSQFIVSPDACTGSPSLVSSARRAFPCKDAALSMYAAIYTVMYVTIMFQAKGTRLTKPAVCLTLLCLTFLTGVVRVSEYRNHWSDVLVGFVTGAAVAVFLVCCVVHRFKGSDPVCKKVGNVSKPVRVMLALPCVESPLEKIVQLNSQKEHERSCFFPSTPDVLIATRSVMSEV
ncbi:phospholipid phosphatase-related protein type 5-like isoform X3 [Hemitrygon akajei]|uniref:phospholipid phosphatase-related protein type 5-like isoform X3 n=1 Tax=Hemitrygon akajei TaxID=2704970 RepID=UPI003BF954C0